MRHRVHESGWIIDMILEVLQQDEFYTQDPNDPNIIDAVSVKERKDDDSTAKRHCNKPQ